MGRFDDEEFHVSEMSVWKEKVNYTYFLSYSNFTVYVN
jgi:hypothetical protein